MTSFKTLISALLLFAVATQPVVAAMMPCCCLAKQVAQAEPTCCRAQAAAVEARPEVALPACCAKKLEDQACVNDGASSIVDRAGCCCLKVPPAVPAERSAVVDRKIDSTVVDLAVDSPRLDVAIPTEVRRFEQLPGSHALSGPALLALLCVWRN